MWDQVTPTLGLGTDLLVRQVSVGWKFIALDDDEVVGDTVRGDEGLALEELLGVVAHADEASDPLLTGDARGGQGVPQLLGLVDVNDQERKLPTQLVVGEDAVEAVVVASERQHLIDEGLPDLPHHPGGLQELTLRSSHDAPPLRWRTPYSTVCRA